MKSKKYLIVVVWILIVISLCANAQDNRQKSQEQMNGRQAPSQPVPVFTSSSVADIILGRPTKNSIVFNILKYDSDSSVYIAFGTNQNELTFKTVSLFLKKDKPLEFVLSELQPNMKYYYQLREVSTNNTFVEGSFHTQRSTNEEFVFTITADSHLDQNTQVDLYQKTLTNALKDAPDFHIDLGDTFMTDKHDNKENAAKQYLAQRHYLSSLSKSVPLFLTLGNHDGEHGKLLRSGPDSLAVWSNSMRKQYFPNPLPSDFYTGNEIIDSFAGRLQDYYAWEWGNTLFVVLNPFWYANDKKNDERWGLSLGEAQYQWLKKTLKSSNSKFKLIFVHQLLGGIDKQGRGGTEAASFGEWGGKNPDGSDGFKEHRQGWDMPIHQLLLENKVNAVFHGHDHFFAKQELDGIVYQEVPQPGHAGYNIPRNISEYGYKNGVILGGSGHIKIKVLDNKLVVEYIDASSRKIIHSYLITNK